VLHREPIAQAIRHPSSPSLSRCATTRAPSHSARLLFAVELEESVVRFVFPSALTSGIRAKPRNLLVFFGSAQIVRALVASEMFKVSVITRDPASAKAAALARTGVTVIRADMRHQEELRCAFEGVFGVFSMQPSSKHEMEMARNVVQMASVCQVSHFVQLSMMGADKKAAWDHAASKALVEEFVLAQHDLHWTILRAAPMMDEFLPNQKRGPTASGLGGFVKPDTKMPLISLSDLAQCVAAVFEAGFSGIKKKKMNLFGEVASMKDIASVIASAANYEPTVKSPNFFYRKIHPTQEQQFFVKLDRLMTATSDDRPSNAAPAVSFKTFAKKNFPKGWKPKATSSCSCWNPDAAN
jgi:uncharacterized protein YbjT (DUF2867 family)